MALIFRLATGAKKAFRIVASVRFAIPVLFIFAGAMIAGTLLESFYGSEFARSAVYRSVWFDLIQGSIALSLLFSVIERVPFRVKLTGFYVVHFSILMILAGSILTRKMGVDGTIELKKGRPSSTVRLGDNRVFFYSGGSSTSVSLPDSFRPQSLHQTIELSPGLKVRLLKYFPYAQELPLWVMNYGCWSSAWTLKNRQTHQSFVLSDTVGGPSSVDLGPLQIELMQRETYEALRKAFYRSDLQPAVDFGRAKFLFVYDGGGTALIPDFAFQYVIAGSTWSLRKIVIGKAQVAAFEVHRGKQVFRFFPRYSPKPVSRHLEADQKSPLSLIDLRRFTGKNRVFLSRDSQGTTHYAWVNSAGIWAFGIYAAPALELPWMGFKLTLDEDRPDQIMETSYGEGVPTNDEQLNFKAIQVEVQRGSERDRIWLTNRRAQSSPLGITEAFVGSSERELPIQLELDRFEVEMVPGTRDKPASYRSTVKIVDRREPREKMSQIYMNHPLKIEGYTLYQSSYLQDEDGSYRSVLAVNQDPGRWVKYVGSFLFILGLIIHFLIVYGYIPKRCKEWLLRGMSND